MLDCMQCYSKLPECLYFYHAFFIDTVFKKRDFMRRYFIAILLCICYVCFFNYVYLWCFMPRYLSEMTKIKIINKNLWVGPHETGTFPSQMADDTEIFFYSVMLSCLLSQVLSLNSDEFHSNIELYFQMQIHSMVVNSDIIFVLNICKDG